MDFFDLPVGTYNLGSGSAAAKVDDLHQLAGLAVLLMLSEAGDRRREIERFLAGNEDWRGFLGDGSSGALSTPLLWNSTALEMRQTATAQAVPSRHVGPKGAGPATIKRKVNNHIRFRHRASGRTLHAYSVHALPSVTRRNLPVAERRARLRHFEQHMTSLARDIARRRGLVVVAGDFNAPPAFPGLAPLRAARLVAKTDEPTHHGVPIDQVWHRVDDAIREKGRFTLELSSDHRALVERLQVGSIKPIT